MIVRKIVDRLCLKQNITDKARQHKAYAETGSFGKQRVSSFGCDHCEVCSIFAKYIYRTDRNERV